jgi:hypothetical protein
MGFEDFEVKVKFKPLSRGPSVQKFASRPRFSEVFSRCFQEFPRFFRGESRGFEDYEVEVEFKPSPRCPLVQKIFHDLVNKVQVHKNRHSFRSLVHTLSFNLKYGKAVQLRLQPFHFILGATAKKT